MLRVPAERWVLDVSRKEYCCVFCVWALQPRQVTDVNRGNNVAAVSKKLNLMLLSQPCSLNTETLT